MSDVRAHIVRHVGAAPLRVFDAWVDPPMIERWLFKSAENRLRATTDARPGGAWSIVEQADGRMIAHDGVYTIVDRPKRLAFSLIVPQHFVGVAQIEVRFAPEGGRTRLEFTARGAGPEDAKAIWERMLGTLVELLER